MESRNAVFMVFSRSPCSCVEPTGSLIASKIKEEDLQANLELIWDQRRENFSRIMVLFAFWTVGSAQIQESWWTLRTTVKFRARAWSTTVSTRDMNVVFTVHVGEEVVK